MTRHEIEKFLTKRGGDYILFSENLANESDKALKNIFIEKAEKIYN